MSIKIRCQRCRKKISIDEGFAGGMCRCPYCKAITKAPRSRGGLSRGARPERPERPDRPQTPRAAGTGEQPGPVESAGAVPLARPVRVQGIVALVLTGFLVLLMALGAILYLNRFYKSGGPGSAGGVSKGISTGGGPETMPDRVEKFTNKGFRIAGMSIKPPVVYVIDSSSGMHLLFDPAVAVVRLSIRTLSERENFNAIVVREEGFKTLAAGWVGGGSAGDDKMKDFSGSSLQAGAADLRAGLVGAIAMKPASIAVLSTRAVSDPEGIIRQARQGGVAIFFVLLGAETEADEVMKKIAVQTGGRCRRFSESDVLDWLANEPSLP